MKKILIVGAGAEQYEMVERAKERGLYIIAVDQNVNSPGFEIADEAVVLSTKDKEAILKLAIEKKVDAISYMITETPMESVRRVCDELNLPGPSVNSVKASMNKGFMRELFSKYNIPNPSYKVITDFIELDFLNQFNYPIVVKPTKLAGQIGLNKYDSKECFLKNYNKDYPNNQFDELIVEEFMDGYEVNVVAVIVDKKIELITLSDRITTDKAFGIATRHIYPSKISYNYFLAIKDMCEKIIEAMEIKSGIIYPQVMITSDGPKLIEIGERIPGGQMKEIFEFSTGHNLVELQLDISLGEQVKIKSNPKKYPAVTVKFITALDQNIKPGILLNISGEEKLRKMEGVLNSGLFNENNKKEIRPLKTAGDRFYYITAVGDTIEKAIETSQQAAKNISFEILTN